MINHFPDHSLTIKKMLRVKDSDLAHFFGDVEVKFFFESKPYLACLDIIQVLVAKNSGHNLFCIFFLDHIFKSFKSYS